MARVKKTFEYLSVAEAAGRLGVSRGRVRQLLLSRELAGHKVGERSWAIPVKAIDAFLAIRKRNSHRA